MAAHEHPDHFDRLSPSEIALILADEPDWRLPGGGRDADRRMADARRLLNHGGHVADAQSPPPITKSADGEATRPAVVALPDADTLKRLLQAGLDAGGEVEDPELRGELIGELGLAVGVVRATDEARRFLGLVLGGKPLTFRDDGRLHEVTDHG